METREPETDGPRPTEAPAEPTGIEALRKSLEEERARAESNLSGWQRAQADFANYRRRVEQERADAARYVGAPVLSQILTSLDDLERALAAVPASLVQWTWVDGVYLIYRKLLTILEAQGIREIPAQGQVFDPLLHEAVLHGQGPEGRVVQVLQKGYSLHDRVLRPALVQVGDGTGSQPGQGAPADAVLAPEAPGTGD